jgi:hypothetical protein
MLSLQGADEGAYALDVIGTTPARYRLYVHAGVQSDELVRSVGRTSRDVPIAAEEVHRYEVEFARAGEEAPRLRLVATDATVGEAASIPARPPRLDFIVASGCFGGPPPRVRVVVPGGAILGDADGGTGAARSAAEDGGLSRRIVFWEAVDGDYVVEISPAATSTSYGLSTSYDTTSAHHAFQTFSANCSSTTVFQGEVHRWVVRLRQHDEAPIRLVEHPDTCVPASASRGPDAE